MRSEIVNDGCHRTGRVPAKVGRSAVKIAVVGPAHPYKGGSAQHTTMLAHRLAAAGHEVMLLSWRSQYPKRLYPGQLTVDDPEVELFPDTHWPLVWYRPDGWWRTGRRIAASGCDAVILAIFTPFQVPAYLTLAKAARARGAKIIAVVHNVLPHEHRRFDKPAMRALLRSVDAIVVHSKEEAALAASLSSTPLEIAALPLHLPHAEAAPQVRGREAAAHNQLLFFGMVRHYKGLDILIRALAETKPDVCLTVAGEIWDGREELIQLISDLRLGNRVTLRDGYVPADVVPAVFATADALVLPYRSGTASQNALIALQFGVPVVATKAGAIADAVIDGVNGLLCAPDDVTDLAKAINRLYEPGVLERLRRGVQPPQTAEAWDAYTATVEKAIS
jgi:glycosyltransferase involved in cell wall biosynthesis